MYFGTGYPTSINHCNGCDEGENAVPCASSRARRDTSLTSVAFMPDISPGMLSSLFMPSILAMKDNATRHFSLLPRGTVSTKPPATDNLQYMSMQEVPVPSTSSSK